MRSQLKLHNLKSDNLIYLSDTEACVSENEILEKIDRFGEEISVILIPGVQYYTGQVIPIEKIVKKASCLSLRSTGLGLIYISAFPFALDLQLLLDMLFKLIM